MIWIWLGVVISLLLIECISKKFSAIWLAFSGMISAVMTYFSTSYTDQLIVFLVVGILLILIVRPPFLKQVEKLKEKSKSNEVPVKKVKNETQRKHKKKKKR